MSKITEFFEPKCIHRHTARTHPHCFNEDGLALRADEYSVRQKAKVLVFDIETLPILGYMWGVWNQNIYAGQIKKDWCVLSYAAKWLGNDKIISAVLTSREAVTRNDKRIVESIWKLVDAADIVVAHNGKRFDIKKLNTRFWKNKLDVPSSYKVIDTLPVAKSVFGLTYNSLDFIAKFIGADEKLDTEFALWTACDEGQKESLQEMKEYNEQDVYSLEEIYMEMRKWIPNHPDLGIYEHAEDACPICVGKNLKEIGLYTSNKLQYLEYRCNDCGYVFHNSKAIKGEKVNG